MTETKAPPRSIVPIPNAEFDGWLTRLRRLHERLPAGGASDLDPTREQISQRAKEVWARNGNRRGTEEQDWLQAEAELRREAPGTPWRQVVPAIDALLHERGVTVVFGGHQKAGKSTLVNGAMRRPILSVDELPETGVICRVCTGDKDEAVVVKDRAGKSRETIACSPEALRAVTALQPGTVRKRGDQLAERVDLTLRGVSIPAGVHWLDAPGMDDTADMTARARQAAEIADVLIFVSPSRQFLSDSESTFLAEHITRNGPASVVLAINAYLEKLTAEQWARFNNHMMGAFRNRLTDRAADIGFTNQAPLFYYPVAANALAAGDGAQFGGPDFMNMLLEIRSPDHPRVRRTRLWRAAVRLQQLAQQLEARRQSLQAKVEKDERDTKTGATVAAGRTERFGRQVRDLVGELVAGVSQEVRQAGTSVRSRVKDDWDTLTVAATIDYDKALKKKSAAAVDTGMNTFLERLGAFIAEHEQNPLPDPAREKIREMLKGPTFNVLGGKDIEGMGAGAELAGAAAAGGASLVLGIFTFGIGTALAAGAGAIAAKVAREKARAAAATEAKSSIRSSIDGQVNEAATQITSKRDAIIKLVLEACSRTASAALPDASQLAAIRELQALSGEADALARMGRQLAGGA